jgi:hypothetical protein
MSVKRHGCYGSTIRCNSKGCPWKITTGQVTKKAIRAYAKSIDWGRRGTRDLCAECFEPTKRAAAERIARRDARRRMTHEQRKQDDRDRRAAKKLADAKGAA